MVPGTLSVSRCPRERESGVDVRDGGNLRSVVVGIGETHYTYYLNKTKYGKQSGGVT